MSCPMTKNVPLTNKEIEQFCEPGCSVNCDKELKILLEKKGKGGIRIMSDTRIMPNDVVKHKPTGETWVVCGVNHEAGKLVPCGYPFPTMADVADCELIEKRYPIEPQTEEQISALQKAGMPDYVDVKSAMIHGII